MIKKYFTRAPSKKCLGNINPKNFRFTLRK